MDKILINRSDAIGDLILTLPMASWVKMHFPNSRVGFVVRSGNRVIAELCNSVDDVFEIKEDLGFLNSSIAFRKIFKEFNPDVFVDVGGNKWGSLASFAFGPKERFGLRHKILPWLFLNKGQAQSRSLALMHESEYNLCLLNNIITPRYSHDKFSTVTENLISNEYNLKKDGRKILSEVVPKILTSDRVTIIHPGMKGHSLNWSARNYARLGQMILERTKNVVIFSYTPGDKEYIDVVRQQLSTLESDLENRLAFLDGSKVGLYKFVKIISSVNSYVGGSTGPTHIAGVLGVPFVSIFSPIRTQSAYRWKPLTNGQKFKVIHPDVVCGEDRFCAGRKCPYHDCMEKIEVKEVFDQFSLISDDS